MKQKRTGPAALCLAAVFCLTVVFGLAAVLTAPVYAGAAAAKEPLRVTEDDITTTGAGVSSDIYIITCKKVEKRCTLIVTVVDKASGVGISDVRVELRDPEHPDTPVITGSPLGVHVTDKSGRIEIKLFPDSKQKYQIWVNHAGYNPYAGDIFIVEKDTSKLVELAKPGSSGGGDKGTYVYYHAGAGGSLDGVDKERVSYNGSPEKIPAAVPDKGYDFAGWMLDGRFVNPEKLNVRKTIHIYAVFELQTAPGLPVKPPSPPVKPSVPPVAVPGSGKPPSSEHAKPNPSGHAQPVSAGETTKKNETGGLMPETGGSGGSLTPESDGSGGSLIPDMGPSIPASGPPVGYGENDHAKCWVHWGTLLCAALTALLGTLRLRAMKRRARQLKNEAQTPKEKELDKK